MSDDSTLSRRELFRGKLFGRGPKSSSRGRAAPDPERVVRQTTKTSPSPAPRREKPFDLLELLGNLDAEPDEESRRPKAPIPMLRPPKAIAEAEFLQACTRCGDCAAACPHDVLKPASSRFRHAAGTPTIDAFRSPCLLCADMPCVSACQTGALREDWPVRIGVARLQTYNCLAYNRSFCSVCAERCPVEGAIEVREGKPSIVDARCVGCGICHSVCPAPQNAIAIMPAMNRPSPTAEPTP